MINKKEMAASWSQIDNRRSEYSQYIIRVARTIITSLPVPASDGSGKD